MARTDRTPRQRLDAETRRDAILAAGSAAFRSAPFAEVKVADVAETAGASSALVFRYFGTKAGLYAAVVGDSLNELIAQQAAALGALSDGVPIRDRVRASLVVYLDHIAADPTSWSNPFVAGDEPPEALAARATAREHFVGALRSELRLTAGWARHEFALTGFFGFVDQAALGWAREGCPEDQRWPLVDAALGALEGALGDWRG